MTMRRREFFEMGAAFAAARHAPLQASSARPARMKLGTQHAETDDILRVIPAFGVTHMCSGNISTHLDEKWSVEGLLRLREHVEKFGLTLEMVQLPTSAAIADSGIRNVLLGKSPERDREIDDVCQMIRNTARAGIPKIKYNLTILSVERTQPTTGRGGALCSTFDYAKANQALTEAGYVSAEQAWERITYFLERVVPVAEEYKTPIACHPHDPPVPSGMTLRGVHRVMGTVEGLKRFISIRESPYHGLNFCQGTVSEMLEKPGEQIYDVIRYFGSRKKIFNVHFRNIKGGLLNFHEAFPDEGDVNMIRAMRVYKEVDYDGMIMPDHAPRIPGDERGRQAYAFEFGYIAALIQLVNQQA